MKPPTSSDLRQTNQNDAFVSSHYLVPIMKHHPLIPIALILAVSAASSLPKPFRFVHIEGTRCPGLNERMFIPCCKLFLRALGLTRRVARNS